MARPKEPSRRKEGKQKTKDALISAWISLFLEQGYEETTLDQVAEKAGVHVQTLYRHFENKEALALGIIVDIHAGISWLSKYNIEESILEKVERYFETVLQFTDDNTQLIEFYRMTEEKPVLKGHNALMYRNSEEHITKLLFDEKKNGQKIYSEDQAKAISSLIMSALWNAVRTWGESNAEISSVEEFRKSFKFIYSII